MKAHTTLIFLLLLLLLLLLLFVVIVCLYSWIYYNCMVAMKPYILSTSHDQFTSTAWELCLLWGLSQNSVNQLLGPVGSGIVYKLISNSDRNVAVEKHGRECPSRPRNLPQLLLEIWWLFVVSAYLVIVLAYLLIVCRSPKRSISLEPVVKRKAKKNDGSELEIEVFVEDTFYCRNIANTIKKNWEFQPSSIIWIIYEFLSLFHVKKLTGLFLQVSWNHLKRLCDLLDQISLCSSSLQGEEL